jgi:hypothetical protein
MVVVTDMSCGVDGAESGDVSDESQPNQNSVPFSGSSTWKSVSVISSSLP